MNYNEVINKAEDLTIEQIDGLLELPSGMEILLDIKLEDLTEDEVFNITSILRKVKSDKEAVKDRKAMNDAIGNAVRGVIFL